MLFWSWPANVAPRLRRALSCATRPASWRIIAAIIFCMMAWLLISADTADAVIRDDDPGADMLMLEFPTHQRGSRPATGPGGKWCRL